MGTTTTGTTHSAPTSTSTTGPNCTETTYECYEGTDGETEYCQRWHPNSVCINRMCVTPVCCYSGHVCGSQLSAAHGMPRVVAVAAIALGLVLRYSIAEAVR